MVYHLQYVTSTSPNVVRDGLSGESLEEAKQYASQTCQTLDIPAAEILEDHAGLVTEDSGTLRAIYIAGRGWTVLDQDPRKAWAGLPVEVREGLTEDPDSTDAELLRAAAEAGAAITGASWEGSPADYKLLSGLVALARWEHAKRYAVSTQ